MAWKDWFGGGKDKPQDKPVEASPPFPASEPVAEKKEKEGFYSVEKQIFEQMGIPYNDILIIRDELKMRITPKGLEETHKKLNRFFEYEGFDLQLNYLEIFRCSLLHCQVNEDRQKNLLRPLSFYDIALNYYCSERLKEKYELDPTSEEVAEMVAEVVEKAAKKKATRLCQQETEHQLRKDYRVPKTEELKVSKEIFQQRFDQIWKEYWRKKRERQGRRPIQS